MTDEKAMSSAKTVYRILCEAIDNREWSYKKDEDNLVVRFTVSGDDIPMQFTLFVDVERQLVRLLSPLPFKMSEDKIMEGAIAVCAASYGMVDGSFDYDLSDGQIVFRMTASFRESLVGEGLFQYMISWSCAVVDAYNDKFLAVNKGLLSINDFVENE